MQALDMRTKTVVFTGTFAGATREELRAAAAALGARVVDSVTRKTDLVFVGDDAGAKHARALELGVRIATPVELEALLAGARSATGSSATEISRTTATVGVARARPLAAFIERFDAMVATLRAHPDVKILNVWKGAPVSEERISAAEVKLGAKLPEDVKAFYRQCDGLVLAWDDKKADGHDEAYGKFIEKSAWVDAYAAANFDARLTGSFNVLPFEEMLFHADWSEQFWFDWMKGDMLTFHRDMRIVDYYYFFYLAGLQMTKPAEAKVYIGDDHGACFDDHKPRSFETYMERALANFAMTSEARFEPLSAYRGVTGGKRLDALLAESRARNA